MRDIERIGMTETTENIERIDPTGRNIEGQGIQSQKKMAADLQGDYFLNPFCTPGGWVKMYHTHSIICIIQEV